MLMNIVVLLVIALVALALYANSRPDSFRVQRATTIQASPEKVFGFVNDFHRWASWSPWEKLDPAMQKTHSGAPSGQGAVYEWAGNGKVGQGRMEITEAVAPNRIAIKLDFLKPMEAHNVAEFSLATRGDATEVVWAMHGPAPFVSKLMGVFVSMDRLIGKDFETGLANLKAAAEA